LTAALPIFYFSISAVGVGVVQVDGRSQGHADAAAPRECPAGEPCAKKSGTALPPLPGLDSSAVTRAGFRVSRRLPTLASRPVVVAAPRQIEPDSELAKLRELAALKAQVSKRRGARAVELLLAHLWRWCCGGTRSNGGGW